MGQQVTFRAEDIDAAPAKPQPYTVSLTIGGNRPSPPPATPPPVDPFFVGPYQVREAPPAPPPITFRADEIEPSGLPPGGFQRGGARPPVGGLGGFLDEATQGWRQIPSGLKAVSDALNQAFWHPLDTGKGLLSAQERVRQEARQAWEQGDYPTATRKFLDWLLPVIGPYVDAAADASQRPDDALHAVPLFGPRLDAAADYVREGNYPRAAGAVVDVTSAIKGPALFTKLKSVPLVPKMNTPIRDAAEFGLREGIPVDVASATGNQYLRGLQFGAEGSMLGGLLVSPGARASQAEELTATAKRLAGRTAAAPATAEGAGAAVRTRVSRTAAAHALDADAAYARLRAIEQQQAALIQQHGGIRAPATSARPFTNVPMAVDLAPTKAAMRATYERLLRERELKGVLLGDEGRALTALDALMEAPDFAPLSIADAALGQLKNLARVDETFRRTAGQGIAAQAVANLDQAVQTSARLAGPDAFRALIDGRAATVNKFKAIAVLDDLSKEPVGIFNQATWRGDSGIERLRAMARLAPAEVRQLGRAWMDDAVTKATREGGGFKHADALYANWQSLGPQTKRLMFGDAAHIKDLDDFFLLAKKMAENPNPSGSARVGMQMAEGVGLGRDIWSMNVGGGTLYTLIAPIIAKVLLSPKTTRLLLQGLRLPLNSNAARVAWLGQLEKALKELDAAPTPGFVPAPAGADQAPAAPASGPGASPRTAGPPP